MSWGREALISFHATGAATLRTNVRAGESGTPPLICVLFYALSYFYRRPHGWVDLDLTALVHFRIREAQRVCVLCARPRSCVSRPSGDFEVTVGTM